MTGRRPARSAAALVGVAALVGALSSCAPTEPPANAATAVLDRASMQVEMPVDHYAMDPNQVRRVQEANEALIDECMRKSNSSNPHIDRYTDTALFPNWRYGLWNAEYVAANGLGDAESESEETLDEAGVELYIACAGEVSLPILDQAQAGADGGKTELNLLSAESYAKTLASADAHALIDEWKECVVGAGLTPDESSILTVVVPDDATIEQRYRAWTTQAECADDLGTVEGLFLIEARFQQQYIDTREALFVEIAEQRDDILARADQILGH